MATLMVSLLAALFAHGAMACQDWEARLINKIVDPRDVIFLDRELKSRFPKTAGGCDNIITQRPTLQPCRNLTWLPLTVPTPHLDLTLHHITGLDTFNFTNLSVRCDTAKASGDKGWFLKMDTAMTRLAVGVDAKMTSWPHLKVSAYCGEKEQCLLDEKNMKVQVMAGLGCINKDTIGLMLDPDDGLMISPGLVLDWHGIKVNLTKTTETVIRGLFSTAKVDCKKVDGSKLDKLCRTLCKNRYEQVSDVVV